MHKIALKTTRYWHHLIDFQQYQLYNSVKRRQLDIFLEGVSEGVCPVMVGGLWELSTEVLCWPALQCYHALLSYHSANRPYAYVYLSPSVRLSVRLDVLPPLRPHVPLAPIATTDEHFSCSIVSGQAHRRTETERRIARQTTTRHLTKYRTYSGDINRWLPIDLPLYT